MLHGHTHTYLLSQKFIHRHCCILMNFYIFTNTDMIADVQEVHGHDWGWLEGLWSQLSSCQSFRRWWWWLSPCTTPPDHKEHDREHVEVIVLLVNGRRWLQLWDSSKEDLSLPGKSIAYTYRFFLTSPVNDTKRSQILVSLHEHYENCQW